MSHESSQSDRIAHLIQTLHALKLSLGDVIPDWIMRAWLDEAEAAGINVEAARELMGEQGEGSRMQTDGLKIDISVTVNGHRLM